MQKLELVAAKHPGSRCLYLGEGDRDSSIQLNVVGQLCELVLLLLKCLQQTVNLLLGQHHSAVVLKMENVSVCFFPSSLWRLGHAHLLERLLAVQTGCGDLRQQDGHVLLLLPQPDEPLAHVSVHHAQRHLLLPTQGLVEVRKVGAHAGSCTLCRARDLERDTEDAKQSSTRLLLLQLLCQI